MAHKKPQSRKTPQITTSQIVFKVLGVQAFLATVGLAIWCAGHYSGDNDTWSTSHKPAPIAATAAAPDRSLPLALGNFAVPAPGNADRHAPIAQSDFSRAFGRLDQALKAHAGQKPDALLANVNAKAGACPIVWNDGEPALTLDGGASHNLDLSAAINRCADAVEKAR